MAVPGNKLGVKLAAAISTVVQLGVRLIQRL